MDTEKLSKFFDGEIVHVAVAGMTNFLGKITSFKRQDEVLTDPIDRAYARLGVHPLGPGWIRMIDPVIMIETNEKGQRGWQISTLGGPYYHYREYVDFFVPSDRPVEIRTLHPDGNLYKQYWREVNAPKRDKIIAPGDMPFNGTPFQQ